jgi:TonB family protein
MMIVAAWLVYCVLIAGMLTLGAAAWERSARWSGRPARWGWLAALAGSVVLPWGLRLIPERGWVDAVPAAATMLRLDALVMPAGAEPAAVWSATDVALAGWIGVSAVMLLWVGVLFARLMRLSRRWRVEELDGGPVLMTRSIGPAALGVRRGMVVLPTWVMDLDAELRSLLLRHERAHVDAGDPRLLLAGLVLLAAMPWNPVVWLQVLRLRNAIELDCDARVLSGGADPARYGALLLEVGRRRSSHALVMATFAEPRVFLEQRIRRIAQWPLERRRGRAALFATGALFLCVTALSARDPLHHVTAMSGDVSADPAPVSSTVGIGPAAVESGAGIGLAAAAAAAIQPRTDSDVIAVSDTPPAAPVFTPMTRPPHLLNATEVRSALERNYPPLLRDAGIGGSPTVHLYVDTLGVVLRTLISKTSGYPALDEAAISIAQTMEFSSAYNRDRKVDVWVEIPIVFQPSDAERSGQPVRRPTPLGERVAPQQPTRTRPAATGQERQATQVDVGPELTNRAEVGRALVRSYPPLLRDAGIGGSTLIWFLIEEDGTVRDTELAASSGYPALDEAAVQVARSMRFTPARKDGRSITAWVQIPIVFTAK